MKITITNYEELLEFIKRDYISRSEAIELVNTYLEIYFPKDISKRTLIASTRNFLDKYGNDYGYELPFFPDVI